MPVTTRGTTCLHCSLCCPAGVAIDDVGVVSPEYPGHEPGSHHGLCARGHFIAELLAHPGRLREAMERGGEEPRAIATDPRGRSALLRGSREGLAVVIDGNLPCEEIARAAHVTRMGLNVDRVAIFIPTADEAVLRGLATSGVERVPKEALAECDIILAVGDPFATHPLVASPILDAIAKARGNRLLCIDSVAGSTAGFAAEFCQVAPGGEAAALAGLLAAMGAAAGLPARCDLAAAAELAGVEPAALESLARAIGGARRLGVAIALPEGRCMAAAAAAALAAKVAEAKGGCVCPLLTYGNAVGAWRMAAALDAMTTSQLVHDIRAGHINRLIVVGTDIVSAIPMPELSAVEVLAAAAAMPSATTARAQLVLPMAFWFELGGTVADGSGALRTLAAAAEPARGALAPSEALARLCADVEPMPDADIRAMAAADPPMDLARALGGPGDWAPPARQEGAMLVVSRADCLGFADGSASRQLLWPAMMEPQPRVRLNPADGPGGGETFGWTAGTVTLRGEGMSLTLPAEVSADVPQGVAAVSPNFPETRMLFAWAATGVGPGHATMEEG